MSTSHNPVFVWTCITDRLGPTGFAESLNCHRVKVRNHGQKITEFTTILTNIHTGFSWLTLNGTVGPSPFTHTEKHNQMSNLVVVFLWSAHSASGWMPAGQTGRQCVATSSIVRRGECLPDSFLNQTESQMPRSKAQWSTLGGHESFPEQTASLPSRCRVFNVVPAGNKQ